ncbi:MAG: LON peptidase substrate-binding domain-containing protein [Phycisphaeraceae bacterium]|nr:MAG: LON peptidase substrate-binding domain-containing protein [Phycisphaeraceae bacterium]
MAEEVSIRVNFARPMPVFPLGHVALLPQQILPMHIFEPRYRQMIGEVLDGPGQIAMATFDGDDWKQTYHGNPPVRPAVCIAQIVQHEAMDDGRFNLLIQGVCRARIVEESLPDETRLYREAMLEPIGMAEEPIGPADELCSWLAENLCEEPLSRLASAEEMVKLIDSGQIPPQVVLEVVSFVLITDDRTRYALLEEGSVRRRSGLVRTSLDDLAGVLRKAAAQKPEEWPKGCSWN